MNISIIENEIFLADLIKEKLEEVGFTVTIFHNFISFDDKLFLSNDDGFNTIKWLRNEKKVFSPISIISLKNDSEKIIYSLNIGADDYIVKLILTNELIAKMNAIIRRSYYNINNSIIKYNNIKLNLISKDLIIGEKKS